MILQKENLEKFFYVLNNLYVKTLIHALSFVLSPRLLHRYSIVSPSFRWTNDGLTMDKRWRNIRGKAEEIRFYLYGKASL